MHYISAVPQPFLLLISSQFGLSWMFGLKMELMACADLVVDCCQFGPNWIFGLKMVLMVCAGLVGVTTEQGCLFPEFI